MSEAKPHAGDLAGGILFLVMGIVIIVAASANPWFTSSGAVGPAAVPGTCGALLTVIGVVQLGFALRARVHPKNLVGADAGVASSGLGIERAINTGDGVNRPPISAMLAESEDSAPQTGEGSVKKALLAWVGVLVAAMLLTTIGTLPTVGALAVFLLAVVGRKGWRTTIIYTACLLVAVYVVFVVLLGIPLPNGIWMG